MRRGYQFTWTHYVYTCWHCHRLAKVAKERLDSLLKDLRAEGVEPDIKQLLKDLDCCISCVAGRAVPGEHDVDAIVTVA